LPAVAWGVLIEFAGWICPLTPLENWPSVQGGDQGCRGSFIDHYLVSLIYSNGLTLELQWLLGAPVLGLRLRWRRPARSSSVPRPRCNPARRARRATYRVE